MTKVMGTSRMMGMNRKASVDMVLLWLMKNRKSGDKKKLITLVVVPSTFETTTVQSPLMKHAVDARTRLKVTVLVL